MRARTDELASRAAADVGHNARCECGTAGSPSSGKVGPPGGASVTGTWVREACHLDGGSSLGAVSEPMQNEVGHDNERGAGVALLRSNGTFQRTVSPVISTTQSGGR